LESDPKTADPDTGSRVLPWLGVPNTEPATLREEFRVPEEAAVRTRIRDAARRVVIEAALRPPLELNALRRTATAVLRACGLPQRFMGFAAVAVHNALWEDAFAATPFGQRLLLLPRCPRKIGVCKGFMDGGRFVCGGCGACPVAPLLAEAGSLGYRTLVAEGTPPVFELLQRRECDAILGVACMESLAESFRLVTAAGVAALAIPLLTDGCRETVMDLEEIRRLLPVQRSAPVQGGVGNDASPKMRLWRAASALFQDPAFTNVLRAGGVLDGADGRDPSEALALDWLRHGGKRLRPYMVLGAAAAVAGSDRVDALDGTEPVARIAVAMEALHKASLVHDDIADDDLYRYGRLTLHRTHGIPTALNAGDHLIGVGYRLVLSTWPELGPAAACKLADALSRTHLRLCRGQGQDLALHNDPHKLLDPLDILTVYARKTGAAFEVALEAGLCAVGFVEDWTETFRRFARALGVAYQIRNDLEDWRPGRHNKRVSAQDALARRPTILRAFAIQALGTEAEQRVLDSVETSTGKGHDGLERVRRFYSESGAFEKASALYEKYRSRAREIAAQFPNDRLQEFLLSLAALLD